MTNPFFSIIIPTYNRALLIERAIQSLLKQSFNDFEIIIVDDGSTDNTEDVIKEFNDLRLFYYKKKNEERNIAKNFGLLKSKGKYIGFLDSDDFVYSNHLDTALKLIESENFPEWIFLNYESRKFKDDQAYIVRDYGNQPEIDLIHDNFLSTNGVFIRNDVFSEYKFLNSRNAIVGEDHFLWLRLASRFKLAIELTPTSVVWFHDTRSLNNIDLDKLCYGVGEIITELKKDEVFLNFYGQKAKWYFAFRLCFVALIAVDNKRYKTSLRFLGKALGEYWPILVEKRFIATLKNIIFGYLKIK